MTGDSYKVHIAGLPHGISKWTVRESLDEIGFPAGDAYCFHKNDRPSTAFVTLTTPDSYAVVMKWHGVPWRYGSLALRVAEKPKACPT
jgi:hypothetical protein